MFRRINDPTNVVKRFIRLGDKGHYAPPRTTVATVQYVIGVSFVVVLCLYFFFPIGVFSSIRGEKHLVGDGFRFWCVIFVYPVTADFRASIQYVVGDGRCCRSCWFCFLFSAVDFRAGI